MDAVQIGIVKADIQCFDLLPIGSEIDDFHVTS